MKSNHYQVKTKSFRTFFPLKSQISICVFLLLASCKSKQEAHWDCERSLPGEFKIVRSESGNKYAIQSSWARRDISDYNEKGPRYEYYYYYLTENENGWVVETNAGGERQFDDSCEAKTFYGLYELQKAVLTKKYESLNRQDSIEKSNHSY